MSGSGVSPSEMRRLGHISDSDLDAIRAGKIPAGDARAEALARLVRDLGDAFPEPCTAELEAQHLAAIMDAVHLMAEKGEPVARPASKAHGSDTQASGLPKSWREGIASQIKGLFATKVAKVVVAAIALVFAFSGIAVAGVLPPHVQDRVADVVAAVGIHIPGGSDEAPASNVDQGDQSNVDQNGASVDQGDANNDPQDASGADEQDSSGADEQDSSDARQQDATNSDHQGSGSSDERDASDGSSDGRTPAGTGSDSGGQDSSDSGDSGD